MLVIFPISDNEEKKYDFIHVADFACNLKKLSIEGDKEFLGTSNIIPNELTFDLVAFKSLTTLVLSNVECNPEKIESISHVRTTLKHLEATNCGLKSIADILLCDTHHMDKDESMANDPSDEFVKAGRHQFQHLEYLNLRYNQIVTIGKLLYITTI